MKSLVLRVGLPLLMGTLSLAPSSWAGAITVTNPSFETLPNGPLPLTCGTGCAYSTDGNIPGWTTTGASGLLQSGAPVNTTYFNTAATGSTIAYANSGSISQTVGATVQLGVIYTLLVDVGVRKDVGDPGTEALVINGNTILATGVLPAAGGFSTFTATYTGLAADVGKAITIQLATASAQGDWDNVRLSDNTTSAVPEPASMMLMGLATFAGAIMIRRKRQAS
jgi:hypothetical protein